MLGFIPIIVIFALSFALFIALKLSTIESIFLSICIIIVLLLGLIVFLPMTVSAIIVAVLSSAFFLVQLVLSIIKKTLIKRLIEYFNNPAFVAFLLVVGIYSLLVMDNHLRTWDDFSHWSLAVRTLIKFDSVSITPGISNSQTIGMPIFNAFVAVFAGLRDSYMIIGMWVMYWASLLLPVSRMKWKQSGIIAAYSIIMYSILIYISHQPRPNLYCDAMLSVIAGSLVSYYYVNKKENGLKSYYIIIAGLAVLPHIKNVMGMVFAVLALFMCSFDLWANKDNRNQKNYIISTAGFLVIILSTVLSIIIRSLSGSDGYNEGHVWFNPVTSLINSINSPVGIGILILFILIGVVLFILYKKRSKLSKPILVLFIIVLIALCGYAAINLDDNFKALIVAFTKNTANLSIYGIKFYKMMITIIVFVILLYYCCINEENKRNYVKISWVLLIQGIIYAVILMLSYSQFTMAEGLRSTCLNRYLLSFIAYAVIGGLGIIVCKDNMIVSIKHRAAIILSIIMLLLFTIMPEPLTVYNYDRDFEYTATANYKIGLVGEQIVSQTTIDDRVFVVTQGDSGHLANLVQNFSLPTYTSRENFSLGPAKYDGDLWSVDLDAQELTEYLVNEGYTHLLIYVLDDYFVETYSSLFENPSDIQVNKLYEIEQVDNNQIIIY